MSDFFEFRQNPVSHEWSIVAIGRSNRPKITRGEKVKCPFCVGNEAKDFKELSRIGKGKGRQSGWKIRVIPNKYPFAPEHELVIHSPNHESNFASFSEGEVRLIFRVYQERFRLHNPEGQVYIFHNHGLEAGESIPHSHSQITVLPRNFLLELPMLGVAENVFKTTKYFELFCPCESSWPYEVWLAPRDRGKSFGEASREEINDLAKQFRRVIKKLGKLEKEADFPFNFYIYPGLDWYLRIIPRKKYLGGFEVGTGIFVNTAAPEWVAKKLAH